MNFFDSISFPAVADLALRVNEMGTSKAIYEVAIFEQGKEEVKAVANLVHVFVDRESGRPSVKGMNNAYRRGLEKLLVQRSKLWHSLSIGPSKIYNQYHVSSLNQTDGLPLRLYGLSGGLSAGQIAPVNWTRKKCQNSKLHAQERILHLMVSFLDAEYFS